MNVIAPAAANAGSAADEHSWDNPDISLLGTNRRPAPAFPIDSLGPCWAQWVSETASAVSAPVDYVAASLLAITAAALANVRWPTVAANGWKEPPVLSMAIVGASSEAKSPAMRPVLNLLRKAEARLCESFDATMRDYELRKQTARVARDNWQKETERQLSNSESASPMPDNAVEPSVPVRPRIETNDATT